MNVEKEEFAQTSKCRKEKVLYSSEKNDEFLTHKKCKNRSGHIAQAVFSIMLVEMLKLCTG